MPITSEQIASAQAMSATGNIRELRERVEKLERVLEVFVKSVMSSEDVAMINELRYEIDKI